MSLTTLGDSSFRDAFTPAKGKSEWGMDTLTRRVSGARVGLEAFIATLAQGQVATGFPGYYLQTWEPDENPDVSTISLNYKGLVTGGVSPDIESELVTAVGTTTKDYTAENSGAGRLYQKDVIAQFGDDVPLPGQFGTTVKWFRERYATGATMQFTYQALQEKIRYITLGRAGPVYTSGGSAFNSSFDNARITTSDGAIFGIDRMAFFELTPIQLPPKTVFFNAKNVIGTPYFECEEVVRIELGSLNP